MNPPRSRSSVAATLLERYLQISIRASLLGVLFTGSWFLLYISIGLVADIFGWLNLPYSFLSLEADPFFTISGAAFGLFITQMSGSLLLSHFLIGFEDEKSQFSVLMGFIALGFGGGVLRMTLPSAVRLLYETI